MTTTYRDSYMVQARGFLQNVGCDKKTFYRIYEELFGKTDRPLTCDEDTQLMAKIAEHRLCDGADVLQKVENPELIGKFTVPKNYNWDQELADLQKDFIDQFSRLSDEITDLYFCRTSNKLLPGKVYQASLVKIKYNQVLTSEEGVKLTLMFGKLYGIQGISYVWKNLREHLPTYRNIVTFDHRNKTYIEPSGWARLGSLSTGSQTHPPCFLTQPFDMMTWGGGHSVLIIEEVN